ncbi:redox-sensing transcriptional repressor Rex [Frisingicoccus sp.]|uniref:redox-sensing transcriptional repressor Rex n=1 Tax=Frisingicoccus sp. TaxID=1918627 RepID=UPI002E9DD2A1|nr:redox-sensing transcriptional repressor Rex [Frisingicoccus sp.]
MKQREISAAVIRRLPRYYRYLGELLQNDVVRISSKELSKRMKVTASQIRQDLNNFGGFGQQGYGYNVEYLHSEIGKILGLDVQHNMIIIGAGNLGQALANYNFEKVGYHLIGIFDTNPRLKGVSVRGIEIYMMDMLDEFVATHKVDVVTLTVPKRQAVEIGHHLEKIGIKAIWNFAPTDLNVSDAVCVKNVHLNESLMTLSYEYRAMHAHDGEDNQD